MNTFEKTETIICSITVKDSSSTLVDPDTSMKVSIYDPNGSTVVDNQTMTRDSTGNYHYDYNPADTAPLGVYLVRYTAVNNARTTNKDDNFKLVGK